MHRKSIAQYRNMGFQAGISVGKRLSQENRRYIKEINRYGCREYKMDHPNSGVSVIMDSLRKGAVLEEVVDRLTKQPKKSWSGDGVKAKKYVQRLITELKSKRSPYWYGWLLKRRGGRYYLTKTSPAEVCYAKFGDPKEVNKLALEARNAFIIGWFDGILRTIQ